MAVGTLAVRKDYFFYGFCFALSFGSNIFSLSSRLLTRDFDYAIMNSRTDYSFKSLTRAPIGEGAYDSKSVARAPLPAPPQYKRNAVPSTSLVNRGLPIASTIHRKRGQPYEPALANRQLVFDNVLANWTATNSQSPDWREPNWKKTQR